MLPEQLVDHRRRANYQGIPVDVQGAVGLRSTGCHGIDRCFGFNGAASPTNASADDPAARPPPPPATLTAPASATTTCHQM